MSKSVEPRKVSPSGGLSSFANAHVFCASRDGVLKQTYISAVYVNATNADPCNGY